MSDEEVDKPDTIASQPEVALFLPTENEHPKDVMRNALKTFPPNQTGKSSRNNLLQRCPMRKLTNQILIL